MKKITRPLCCLLMAVLTLTTAFLAGCGKQPGQTEAEPFDGAFSLVMTSEYEGELTKLNFRLSVDQDGKKTFLMGSFTEPYRTPEDMEPLVCGKQYNVHLANLEYLTDYVNQPNFRGIWARFEVNGNQRGCVFIPKEQLDHGAVRVVLDELGNVVSEDLYT